MQEVHDVIRSASVGFAVSATLIIAIGAQNAFVLRQGLLRQHVGTIVLFCATADACLMAAGVWGLGQVLERAPGLGRWLTVAGALFLAAYGLQALRRALSPKGLSSPRGPGITRQVALLQAAAFTLLNPHVYLDTVLLVGAVGSAQPASLRSAFVGGAAMASALWFTLLGYGARWLAPWFARPAAWRWLDGGIGVTMWIIAALLFQRLWTP